MISPLIPVATPVPAGFTPQAILAALVACGRGVLLANIEQNWPLLQAALAARALVSAPVQIAAIATVAVETGSFAPVKERGGPAYFRKLYWDDARLRAELGNQQPEDAVNFRGRGFVQITGRSNYQRFGQALGIDLVAQPDRALDPEPAAAIFALFFQQRKIDLLAAQGDWIRVRRAVNGGLNAWGDFIKIVGKLQEAIPR